MHMKFYVYTHTLSSPPSPVLSGPSPENEIVITVVTNGTGTEGIRDELEIELMILTEKFGCQFHNLERFGEPSIPSSIVARSPLCGYIACIEHLNGNASSEVTLISE